MHTFLAQALSENPPIGETLQYQFVGFSVVMLTLISIWMALEISGHFFRKVQKSGPIAQPAPVPIKSTGLTPQEIAAISAAVHTTIKGPFHILSVAAHDELLTKPNPQQQAWSMEGRRAIFSSHRVR